MNIEQNRLNTFSNWNVSFIDKERLALFGFYYYGPGDLVKCYFCGVEIGMWEDGDDVLADHKRWSPQCPLINGHHTINVPQDQERFRQFIPPATPSRRAERDTVILAAEADEEANEEADEERRGDRARHAPTLESFLEASSYLTGLFAAGRISFGDFYENIPDQSNLETGANQTFTRKFAHPEYVLELNRIKTFKDWPIALTQTPEMLSDAGFYYTGTGDKVTCFACGGGLKNWKPEDIPWEQHAFHYRSCLYVKRAKGQGFIDAAVQKLEEDERFKKSNPCATLRNGSEGPSENNDPLELNAQNACDENENENMCRLCDENKYNAVFIPCGHVYACIKCAFSVKTCPVCRDNHTDVVRLYFS